MVHRKGQNLNMSAQSDLGQYITTYSSPRLRRVGIRLVLGAVLAGGAYFLISRDLSTAAVDNFGIVIAIFLLIGTVLMLIAIFSLPGAMISMVKGRRIVVHEKGFILADNTNSTVVKWTDIDAINHTSQYVRFIVMMGETKYTIKLKQGDTLTLSSANFHKLDDLGHMIEDKLRQRTV